MRVIPLATVPNQSFTLTLDGFRWTVRLASISYGTVCDLAKDGTTLLSAVRVVAGEPIIPYSYLQSGNFIFLTQSDILPIWGLFGTDQILVYLSTSEIASTESFSVGNLDMGNTQFLYTDDGLYITTDVGELIQNA